MDYNKIGNFIMQERKRLGLTQLKLAELIFVSEKTISKWENGKGIPDTNSLAKLCEIFKISINELLNGERLSSENYATKAEIALLKLQKEKEESDKRLLLAEIFIGSLTIISFLLVIYASIYAIYELNYLVVPFIAICFGIIILIIGITICLYIEQKAGFYHCKKCNHKYVPKFKSVLFAPHINRTRYMKCPNCKQKSWQKKVTK